MLEKKIAMTELRCLVETKVAEDQIDHLGHMNVRYYHERASEASDRLASELGLSRAVRDDLDAVLEVRKTFTRHYREQLEGAPLVVMGGVLELHSDGLRAYHELRNTERDELAATFVHDLELCKRRTRARLPLPEMLAKRTGDARVAWPEHGRPRTLDLDRDSAPLALSTAMERDLAMRLERVLRPKECDADGFFPTSRYIELVWGGEPFAGRAGLPLFELPGGGKFGWATLESRSHLLALPRAGTRIQSFGAEVALAPKTSCRHHWVFDVERGDLLCIHSIVNLAFDIAARRAIEIPAPIRAEIEQRYHPDLR